MTVEILLNELIGSLGVLYIKLHQHHFYVKGHHFFKLHELFEDYYNEVHDQLDEVAERLLMIHGKPISTLGEFLEVSHIQEKPYTIEKTETEMLRETLADFKKIVSLLETGIKLESIDEVTQDLLIGIKASYDKHLWMLSARLND